MTSLCLRLDVRGRYFAVAIRPFRWGLWADRRGCKLGPIVLNWLGVDTTARDVDRLRGLLVRARLFVEQDAQMMADITRHAPLPPDAQAKHDSTPSLSELLLPEIDAALKEADGPSIARGGSYTAGMLYETAHFLCDLIFHAIRHAALTESDDFLRAFLAHALRPPILPWFVKFEHSIEGAGADAVVRFTLQDADLGTVTARVDLGSRRVQRAGEQSDETTR